jgi:hypothetical protein
MHWTAGGFMALQLFVTFPCPMISHHLREDS